MSALAVRGWTFASASSKKEALHIVQEAVDSGITFMDNDCKRASRSCSNEASPPIGMKSLNGTQAAAAMDTARLYQAEQQARGAAENANKTKDNFIAALSHELRTPLTPVLALLSSVTEAVTLPPALAADLAMARHNVELESRLIDDLLDLTRVSHDKLELHREPVAVGQLIENAIATCLPDINAKKLTLVRNFPASQQTIFADSARITQVLWNLLKNAIKFTPSGGTITQSLGLGLTQGREEVIIGVEDSGIGIEPSQLGHVFEAFDQGGRGITQQFGGLGRGLAISKAIVDAHQGTISAASEGRNRGSRFRLTLPCAAPKTSKTI